MEERNHASVIRVVVERRWRDSEHLRDIVQALRYHMFIALGVDLMVGGVPEVLERTRTDGGDGGLDGSEERGEERDCFGVGEMLRPNVVVESGLGHGWLGAPEPAKEGGLVRSGL